MFDYGNPKDTHWMLNTNATEKPDYWRPKCKSIHTFLWKQIDGISTTFPIERLSQHKYVFSIICLFFWNSWTLFSKNTHRQQKEINNQHLDAKK